MAYYGRGQSGKNLYGGKLPRLTAGGFTTCPVLIELFDANGTRKDYFQSGSTDLLSVEFSLAETGCNDFQISFATIKNISKNDKIKIKLFTSDVYFFSGVVREIPIKGSTKQSFIYSGFGMNDYFQRILTGNNNYLNKSIAYIVNDLLNTYILPNTLITKNAGKLSALTTIITDCTFYYVPIYDALSALQKMACSDGNNYIVGVDESNDFFFKIRDTDTKAALIVGKRGRYGIASYDPKDTYEARTKYHVIRDDGTYFGAVTSTEGNDIYEDKIAAPAGLSDTDIALWAAGMLKEKEVNQRSATIDWQIESYYPDLLKSDGNLRIVSSVQEKYGKTIASSSYGTGLHGSGIYGGEQYTGYLIDDTLKIVDVKYSISPGGANRSITLGAREISQESQIVDVKRKLTELTINLGR
jgi:hypothetical protein